jgi:1,4-dihydroxy-2-naphthoyl-CoA hydrolase
MLWKRQQSLEQLNAMLIGNMCEHVGLTITEIGDDFLCGEMPVDARTSQHMGIIHGGASVVLAETLGSMAAGMSCLPGFYCVGLDINANHVRAGIPPKVFGIARPIHVGFKTSVWDIRITDIQQRLVCIARLTVAILQENKQSRESRALPDTKS